jgi:O-antigen chain-terminating methyltransferase
VGEASEPDPKLAELAALLEQVRAKVAERHARLAPFELALPDLMPVLHARDAAYGKVAAIGTVNPRPGGLVNRLIQQVKGLVARSLQWFVREQVEFNKAAVASMEAVLAALEDNNRTLRELAGRMAKLGEQLQQLRRDELEPALREFHDLRAHWIAWRGEWARKLEVNEVQFLRGLADLQNAFHQRVTLMEASHREVVKAQHADFEGALARTNREIQQRVAADFERVSQGFHQLIHEELRVMRQKAWMQAVPPAGRAEKATPEFVNFDWWRFADKFRGPESYVRAQHEYYLPFFAGLRAVVDLGCGRGEFLSLLAEHGVPARGVELSAELTAYCRQKGLEVEQGDLFEFLAAQPRASLDGVFCAQVVEHLPPARVWELVQLAFDKLAPRGVLAIETPNPECLAIFASHFFIDPTHVKPVPPALLEFYFYESGFGEITVRRFAPAAGAMEELNQLPAAVRERFFGSLDYAVIGRKLA